MFLSQSYHPFIAQEKLTGYLLNAMHPDGASKASFFIGNGLDNAGALQTALLYVYQHFPVIRKVETVFGWKFIVDGNIAVSGGRVIHLRTVWIVLTGDDICTFVTAYPL